MRRVAFQSRLLRPNPVLSTHRAFSEEKNGLGAHDFKKDDRNKEILIYLNGDLVPKEKAMVSVYDAGFMMGDGIWEGLRLYNGKFGFLDQHLKRIYEAAKFMDMDIGMSAKKLEEELYRLVEANGMVHGVHARLMITRGVKDTPYQSPKVNKGPPTICVIAEYKESAASGTQVADPAGIKLATVWTRRGYADSQDQKLNSHSKINCITACIAAVHSGADEALMLDPTGQVATCNSTHFFIVRDGEVWTSQGNHCIPGITRSNIIKVCRDNGIVCHEKDFSMYEVYGADEAFVTGTFAGVTPVAEIDGRKIGQNLSNTYGDDWKPTSGPTTRRLRELYQEMVLKECPPLK